ncbi:hypothetical protein C8R43DRAFT_1205405 [Mycena crocata]|nr:hypothetical protein C8R43DRAFT_1205405 [Mycena crocata]
MQDSNISPNPATEIFEISAKYGAKFLPMLPILTRLVAERLRGSTARASVFCVYTTCAPRDHPRSPDLISRRRQPVYSLRVVDSGLDAIIRFDTIDAVVRLSCLTRSIRLPRPNSAPQDLRPLSAFNTQRIDLKLRRLRALLGRTLPGIER